MVDESLEQVSLHEVLQFGWFADVVEEGAALHLKQVQNELSHQLVVVLVLGIVAQFGFRQYEFLFDLFKNTPKLFEIKFFHFVTLHFDFHFGLSPFDLSGFDLQDRILAESGNQSILNLLEVLQREGTQLHSCQHTYVQLTKDAVRIALTLLFIDYETR